MLKRFTLGFAIAAALMSADFDARRGFFNTGVSAYAAPNRGLYEQTNRTGDIGKFRAPSLAGC